MSILTNKETWELIIDGKSMLDEYYFSNMKLTQEINRPNELHFRLRKKSMAETEEDLMFGLSKELLGKSIELSFKTLIGSIVKGNENSEDVLLSFKGIIFNVAATRQSMKESLVYEITAYSPDYLLIDNPHCFSYENETLKNIVANTLDPYDITFENEPNFEDEILYTVQYNETNYAFLTRLAIRFGEWFYYDGEKLVFGKIKKLDQLELIPTQDVLNYSYRLMTSHLKFSHNQHNYLNYENTKKEAGDFIESPKHGMTGIALDASEEVFTKETFQHFNGGIAEEFAYDEIETSVEVQTLGKIEQFMTCSGSSNRADLKIGSVFVIKEDYREDDYTLDEEEEYKHDPLMVIKISHFLDNKGLYQNDFLAVSEECEYPPYSYGEMYPRMLTQRAVVKDNKDPEKLGRVRVQFLWQKEQDEEMMTPWIRIAQPHGGNNKGFYFIPEIEEEVMVGFENGNAEKPYVIGTLYQGEQKPHEDWVNDDNDIKAIRTRSGHTIEINDVSDGGFIKIYDHEKENYILTFSTDDKLIKLESTGNIELYAKEDIIMKAEKNITIEAKENMDIQVEGDMSLTVDGGRTTDVGGDVTFTTDGNWNNSVTGDMDVSVTGNLSMSGMELSGKGNTKLALEGAQAEIKASATMKVDGGGMLELKGGMVKIN